MWIDLEVKLNRNRGSKEALPHVGAPSLPINEVNERRSTSAEVNS
jgi:hypothetical protein